MFGFTVISLFLSTYSIKTKVTQTYPWLLIPVPCITLYPWYTCIQYYCKDFIHSGVSKFWKNKCFPYWNSEDFWNINSLQCFKCPFTLNLISSRKLGKDLQCYLIFSSQICVIQELLTCKTIRVGDVKHSLYKSL